MQESQPADNAVVALRAPADMAPGEVDLRALMDTGGLAVAVVDAACRTLYLSPAAARILQLDPDILDRGIPAGLLDEDAALALRHALCRLLDGETPSACLELPARRGDGHRVHLGLSLSRMQWNNTPAVAITIEDRSEQEKLRKSLENMEHRYQTLAAAGQEWYWETDAQHRIQHCSLFAEGRGAYLGECCLGVARIENAHPDTDPELWRRHQADLAAHRPFREVVYRHNVARHDGVEPWFRIRGEPRFDDHGRFVGYTGTGVDVTDEVQNRETVQRLESALVDVVKCLPVGFALFDPQERLTLCNEGYLAIHGPVVTPFVQPGITFPEIIDLHMTHGSLVDSHGDEQRWWDNRVSEFRAGGTVRAVQRTDGCWHQINDRRLSDGSTVVICTDITELKTQEAALDDARQRLEDYADAASDWFWESDAEHRLTFVSERFTELTGIPASRFLGHFRTDAPDTSVGDQALAAHLEDLRHRRPFRDFRYRIDDAEGVPLHVSINGVPVYRDGEGFVGYRGTGVNITDMVVAKATQERFMAAIESISDAYSLWDSDDRLVVFNSTWVEFIRGDTTLTLAPGLPHEELVRNCLENGAYPSAAADPEAWLAERLRRHRSGDHPFEMERRNGRWYLVHERRTPDGGILQTASDISALKRREQALRESEERFKGFAETAADWFWELDANFHFTFISSRFEQVTGVSGASLMGQPFEQLAQGGANEQPLADAVASLRAGDPIQDVEFYSTTNGSTMVVHSLSGQPIHGLSGGIVGYRGTGRDVTSARLMSMQLAYQASHDELTGLVNRRGFEQRLARAMETVSSGQGRHALCYLDLDQFKVVNDTCGHAAGDMLLKQLGVLLQERVRGRDTVARLGGDEFAVLLESCSLEEARRVAETLRGAIEMFQFNWQDKHFRLGASLGVVMVRAGTTMSELMRAVDSACYVAKEQGRNRVHVYEPDDRELSRRAGEMNWVARLNKALAEDRFTLFAQPIKPCVSGAGPEVQHYEILLRMLGEDGELIAPGSFLPSAERYGLATRIDRWVIQASFELLRSAPRGLAPASFVSINLSGQSLGDRDFCDYVLHHLRAGGVEGNQVCFEVTETSAIADLAAAERFIEATREHGCQFALDDFGTGLSSFAYLRDLAVDFVKIDGAFIKDIETDPVSAAMVRSIHQVASVLGKRTIAEYVSNGRAIELLAEIGVDYVQGFGVGRPQPVDLILR